MGIERTEAQGLEEFKGTVESVELEDSKLIDAGSQFHIKIKALDVKVEGKTGYIHDWIRQTETTTANSVPRGSVIDRYLAQLEIVMPEVKKCTTVEQAFKLLVGKTFTFKKMALGKAFSGHEARSYWLETKLWS
jgi:hypothetical protein